MTAGEPSCLIIGRCKACIVRIRYKLGRARLSCHIGTGAVWRSIVDQYRLKIAKSLRVETIKQAR
jgi:hypothetical protein